MRILWDPAPLIARQASAPLIVWSTSPMAIKGLIEYPEFYERLARERQRARHSGVSVPRSPSGSKRGAPAEDVVCRGGEPSPVSPTMRRPLVNRSPLRTVITKLESPAGSGPRSKPRWGMRRPG